MQHVSTCDSHDDDDDDDSQVETGCICVDGNVL